jgi:hypothetical protein
MESLMNFCRAAQRPATLFAFLLSTLNLFASASPKLHSFLHQWRSILLALCSLCLIILIANTRTFGRIIKESNHVG